MGKSPGNFEDLQYKFIYIEWNVLEVIVKVAKIGKMSWTVWGYTKHCSVMGLPTPFCTSLLWEYLHDSAVYLACYGTIYCLLYNGSMDFYYVNTNGKLN